MATAWRPSPIAGCRLARGPRFRCFRNAVTYRRDNLINLRFMNVCRNHVLQLKSSLGCCNEVFDPSFGKPTIQCQYLTVDSSCRWGKSPTHATRSFSALGKVDGGLPNSSPSLCTIHFRTGLTLRHYRGAPPDPPGGK